jgi:hypothetical protein
MIEIAAIVAFLCVPVYLFVRRSRERARNTPLRGEIVSMVRFEARLSGARILGAGGFRGTRGQWISIRGQTRLVVGSDAFLINASQALREYVFRGCDSSITFAENRDWIVITGQDHGRQIQVAITRDNLPEVWQALARTGAAQL